ncbi:CHASE2 domain-containing protein [Clostridium sp. OM02-18AC]|nr:CHASE2 domain-containing protein [Clostridium sp. OM02-18AC]
MTGSGMAAEVELARAETVQDMEMVQRYVSKPPVDAHAFWYLPFAGLPGDYSESISVADILSGDVPPKYFADRIVLIGPMQQDFRTAIPQPSIMQSQCMEWSIRQMQWKRCLWAITKKKHRTSGSIWQFFWLQACLDSGSGNRRCFRQPSAGSS